MVLMGVKLYFHSYIYETPYYNVHLNYNIIVQITFKNSLNEPKNSSNGQKIVQMNKKNSSNEIVQI